MRTESNTEADDCLPIYHTYMLCICWWLPSAWVMNWLVAVGANIHLCVQRHHGDDCAARCQHAVRRIAMVHRPYCSWSVLCFAVDHGCYVTCHNWGTNACCPLVNALDGISMLNKNHLKEELKYKSNSTVLLSFTNYSAVSVSDVGTELFNSYLLSVTFIGFTMSICLKKWMYLRLRWWDVTVGTGHTWNDKCDLHELVLQMTVWS